MVSVSGGRLWVVVGVVVASAGWWLLLLGWLVGVVVLILLERGVRLSRGIGERESPWAVTMVVDVDMVVNGRIQG